MMLRNRLLAAIAAGLLAAHSVAREYLLPPSL
jgi:hypothetical protein